jgi:hypothetical protein
MASLLSGTECALPAFILPAGIVHVAASRSISSHVAPMTSPERAAVRMARASACAAAL